LGPSVMATASASLSTPASRRAPRLLTEPSATSKPRWASLTCLALPLRCLSAFLVVRYHFACLSATSSAWRARHGPDRIRYSLAVDLDLRCRRTSSR
jgi:hypothetical protein